MRNFSGISKSVLEDILKSGKEVCTIDIIEHIVLLYSEYKTDYVKNIFDKTGHPELDWDGDEIDINKYIRFIEKELPKDKISINIDLLIKIIYLIRDYYNKPTKR